MAALALVAFALGLLLLPEDFSNPVRLAVRDLSRPGQTVTRIGVNSVRTCWCGLVDWQARRTEIEKLKSRLQTELSRQREYQQELADLRQRLREVESGRAGVASAAPSDPLFLSEFVEARVLGQETVDHSSGRKILGVGGASGVSENLLVVESGRSTLDIGTTLGVTQHQPVFSGEIVIGRTATCGRHSCSLQSVTDAKFQGAAQLLKKTGSGWQSGAEGVLEGTGKDFCRLSGIGSKAAVEVGDEVYTPADDPLLPHPMYYGRIVRAELNPGMPHWEIDVEPASKNLRLAFVRILRPTENRARIMAD